VKTSDLGYTLPITLVMPFMKIVQADDHQLVRDGIHYLLQRLDADVDILNASSVADTLNILQCEEDVDLVLTDLAMPGMGDFEGIRAMRECCPEIPIVVLSASENPYDVRTVLKMGVSGYIPKSASSELMLQAIKLVLAGGVYRPDIEIPAEPSTSLTTRQREILHLIAQGKSNKLIARDLDLTEGTVKQHINAIFRTLNVNTRMEAVARAKLLGEVRDW